MKTVKRSDVRADLVDEVDALNEEVKVLALNLAIYLARAKEKAPHLARLEPEFIRLVNTAIKVVRQLALVIHSARNLDQPGHDAAGVTVPPQIIEPQLRSILEQCQRIMGALSVSGELMA
ncbi:MAG TPA: hypothetical protein VN285_10005 [Candidatus Deferrimicrobium sp.]|nr:hypothetical protein [Candidatus Deferrimicrobium sp.]